MQYGNTKGYGTWGIFSAIGEAPEPPPLPPICLNGKHTTAVRHFSYTKQGEGLYPQLLKPAGHLLKAAIPWPILYSF